MLCKMRYFNFINHVLHKTVFTKKYFDSCHGLLQTECIQTKKEENCLCSHITFKVNRRMWIDHNRIQIHIYSWQAMQILWLFLFFFSHHLPKLSGSQFSAAMRCRCVYTVGWGWQPLALVPWLPRHSQPFDTLASVVMIPQSNSLK